MKTNNWLLINQDFIDALKPGDVINLFGVIISLVVAFMILRQLIQLKKSLISSTQANLYNQSAEIRKLIADNPDIFPYIYGGEKVEDGMDPKVYHIIHIAALMQLSYLENLITQEGNIDKKNHIEWLENFIPKALKNSPEMVKLFEGNKDVYSKKLHCYYDKYLVEKENQNDI